MSTPSPDRTRSLVVFDGDDTLWWTEPLYDRARSRAAILVAQVGLDPGEWDRLERELDVANVATFGLSRSRFPTSCVQAYERLAAAHKVAVDARFLDEIWAVASSVFDEPAQLADGAVEVLALLSSGAVLALLTRGDTGVQRRRLNESRLEGWFDLVEVVPEKTPREFERLLRLTGGRPEESWSIGNSRRSDLEPALAAGMHAIWIDAHVWEYERDFAQDLLPRLHRAEKLSEVPGIILRTTSTQ
jgi:putative hydrolase of the HAD superfamily